MAKAKVESVDTDIRTEKFTQSLKVQLTTGEIADRADRAAQMIAERDGKEEEMKAAQKHAKSIIESMDGEIRRLSNEVRTKSTYRPVECERRFRYGAGIMEEVRLDTGEIVSDRRMTAFELQRELPVGEPPTEATSEINGHKVEVSVNGQPVANMEEAARIVVGDAAKKLRIKRTED